MADRSQVAKSVGYVVIGADACVSVSKVVAYVLLQPGEEGPDTSNRQGHAHSQIIRRR